MKEACFWEDPSYVLSAPLAGDEKCAYCVVGGGVAGLFTAHFLLEAGETDIVLIEKETVGSGSTGRSAGMLVGEIETAPWSKLIAKYGADATAVYMQAQKDAQAEVTRLVREYAMDCDFSERDFVLVNDSEWAVARTLKEFALKEKIDPRLPALLEKELLQEEIGGKDFVFGERLERSVSVNPLKFAHCMKRYLAARGVRIYEHTPFVSAARGTVTTPHGRVKAGKTVYALGTDSKHSSLVNYMTTICITRPLTHAELEGVRLSDKDMFQDDKKRSYHYGKVTADNRLLLGYGDVASAAAGAGASLHAPHVDNIRRFLDRFVGRDIPVEYAWTGQYSLSKKIVPRVAVRKNAAFLGGAGTQLASVACASYVASALRGARHPLDVLFKGA